MTTPIPQKHSARNWRDRFNKTHRKLSEQLNLSDNRISFLEWLTVTVIILSSLMIGAKTYALPPVAILILGTLDNAVIAYFVVEILARFAASENNRSFFRDGWNLFDTLIVIASLVPIPDSEYALLGRLLRLLRVMRLFTFLPKLRELLSSMLRAIPEVAHVVLMMFIVFYIYGAIGSLMFAKINPGLWENIGAAMITMFRIATLEDWTDIMYGTMVVHPMSWIFYISFILFVTFILMNMIVGIIVQVFQSEAEGKQSR